MQDGNYHLHGRDFIHNLTVYSKAQEGACDLIRGTAIKSRIARLLRLVIWHPALNFVHAHIPLEDQYQVEEV